MSATRFGAFVSFRKVMAESQDKTEIRDKGKSEKGVLSSKLSGGPHGLGN